MGLGASIMRVLSLLTASLQSPASFTFLRSTRRRLGPETADGLDYRDCGLTHLCSICCYTLSSPLLILIVVLMNTVKCPGCSQTFDQGISIKMHQRKCTALHLAGQKQIKKRVENAQKREAVKLARIEGQTMDDIAEERQELQENFNDVAHGTPCLRHLSVSINIYLTKS